MLIFLPFYKNQQIGVAQTSRLWKQGSGHYLAVSLSWMLSVTFLLLASPAFGVVELEEQLNIPLNNGTQGEMREEADRLIRFGRQQQRQGNLEKAIPYWLRALRIYQGIGDYQGIARTYDALGLAYAELGRYPEAEDALRRWLGVARTNKDLHGQVYALNNVGTILLGRRNPSGARAVFEEALAIARNLNDAAGIGLSLSNLGLAAEATGDYNQAIKRSEEALRFRRRGGDPIGEANTYNNLGDAYRALGRYRDAIGTYGAALRIARDTRDRRTHYRAIDGLVSIYSGIGPYNRAVDLLQERLAISQESENRREELRSLLSLAHLAQQLGDGNAYQRFYHQALSLAHALGYTREASLLH